MTTQRQTHPDDSDGVNAEHFVETYPEPSDYEPIQAVRHIDTLEATNA